MVLTLVKALKRVLDLRRSAFHEGRRIAPRNRSDVREDGSEKALETDPKAVVSYWKRLLKWFHKWSGLHRPGTEFALSQRSIQIGPRQPFRRLSRARCDEVGSDLIFIPRPIRGYRAPSNIADYGGQNAPCFFAQHLADISFPLSPRTRENGTTRTFVAENPRARYVMGSAAVVLMQSM